MADRIALAAFLIELLLRAYAHGWRLFTDAWSVFDVLVVGVVLVPAAGSLSVLRTLRAVSVVPVHAPGGVRPAGSGARPPRR